MKSIRLFFTGLIYSLFIQTTSAQSIDSLSVFPNPFQVSATAQFELAQSDTLTIVVYNMLGAIAETIQVDEIMQAGTYSQTFGSGLQPGVYIVRLNYGTRGFKTRKAIKVGGTTEMLSTTTAKEESLIFPNPATNLIYFVGDGTKTILVSDLSGKILLKQTTDLNSISISELPSGIYIISILDGKGKLKASQKLLKM